MTVRSDVDTSEFENDLLELAVRRVRTPEGAEFYDLPIGSPITQDVIDAKRAEKAAQGIQAPKGALSSGSKGSTHMVGTIAGKAAAEKNAPKPAKPQKLKIKKSTLVGNKHFSVGGSKYTAPNNSKLIKPIGQDGLAYVVTPDGEVHAFNAAGEIEIPAPLKSIFETKFAGDLEGDTKYEVADFDATSASFAIEELHVGQVLNDVHGTPQFKKTGEGEWEHVDLGVSLDEADIKPLYDEGELVPADTPDTQAAAQTFDNSEATNFAEMSTEEVISALDGYATGQKLTMGKPGQTQIVTKNEDGTWTSEQAPNTSLASASLALFKSTLKIGQDEDQDGPDEKDLPDSAESSTPASKSKQPTPRSSSSLVPGEGSYTQLANPDEIENAVITDRVLVSFADGSMVSEYELNDSGSWGNVDDPTESLGHLTMKALAENDGAEQVYKHRKNSTDGSQMEAASKVANEIPGEGDYTEKVSDPAQVDAANVGAKFLVEEDLTQPYGGPFEYELEGNALWVNTNNDGDVVEPSVLQEAAKAGKLYANGDNTYDPVDESSADAPTPVMSTKLAYSPGMKGLDVGNKSSKHYITPGGDGYSHETTVEDVKKAKAGDKIVVGYDAEFTGDWASPASYEAADLVEKQPDGTWKSLAHPDATVTEDGLLKKIEDSESQAAAEQLYSFSDNSNLSAPVGDSGVSEGRKEENNGGSEDGPDGGNAGSEGSGDLAEESQSGLGGLDGPGDSGGNGVGSQLDDAEGPSGVKLADGSTPALLNDGQPMETSDRVESLRENGLPIAEVFELDSSQSADVFHSAITKLKENNPYHASVYVYDEAEYKDMRLFLNSDGTAGFALKGDEIVSVFVAKDSKDVGSSQSLVARAVSLGGKRLDAFDTVLPKIYAKEGFVPVARTPWNDEYSPNGWDKETYAKFNGGEPDVVFMAYDPAAVDSKYDPGAGKVVSEYDQGVELTKNYSPKVSLPKGVPAGSIPLDKKSLDSVGVGAHIFEYSESSDGSIEYERVEDAEYPWNALLPSGLVAPLKQSYLENTTNPLYLAPSAEDLAPEGNWEDALMVGVLDPGAADSGSTKVFKVGDTIHSVEDLEALLPNATLSYAKKDGSKSKYVKLENGSLLTPGGGVMAPIQLKGSAKSGKFTIESLPEPPSAPSLSSENDFGYADGESITMMAHVNGFQIGQTLEFVNPADTSTPGKHMNFIEKSSNGWVVTDDGFLEKGEVLSPTEMGNLVTNGALKYVASKSTETLSVDLDTQLYPGAPAMSKKDIQDAYDSLKAHTSFQVAYGLKSLDASHPLASKEAQEELKVAALNAHPDLKTKPAVMQLLQDALGVKPSQGSDDSVADSPKVWLGSKTPKEGVQGFDGGEFTATEIQKAIDILEAYSGKLFKSELNKKGNPLGKLNPNDLVGFDKDKLVTKQKFIDLLKMKLVSTEENLKHPRIHSIEELNSLPIGTQVSFTPKHGATTYYTKISDSQWMWDDPNGSGSVVTAGDFTFIDSTTVRVEKMPDVLPDYAKTPAAVQDKQVDEIDVENFTSADIPGAKVGTILEGFDDPNPIYLVKDPFSDSKPWTIVFHDGSQGQIGFTDNEVLAVWEPWKLSLKQQDGPSMNPESSELVPGKYVSGGKAYMVVHTDGTGVYVNSKGEVQKLTAKAVKANFDKGMNKYQGMPDEVPSPTKKGAAKPKPKVVADIPDGTYFAGNPNSPKTAVYEVKGDSVKVFKPVTVPGHKIGQGASANWANEASVGAAFVHSSHWDYSINEAIPEIIWTKGSDGKWHPNSPDGEPKDYAEIKNTSGWNTKIKSHGLSTDPVTISKSKLNTLFAQGKFLDSYGNSVVPNGYSGAVHFFGSQTTIPALLSAQKLLNEKEFETSSQFQSEMKAQNIYWDAPLVEGYTLKNVGDKNLENYVTAFKQVIGDMVQGLDTDIPESDAAELFEWNDLGEAKMPLELAAKTVAMYDNASLTSYLKAASAAIGDGKIIGQHYPKMDKMAKSQWVTAFKAGDFKKMYTLEVAAAAKEGKAHNAGYLHPGYSGNEKTNTITWGAAVEGEISALSDIPGNWSAPQISPSLEEINNYLIKAQMQNPTFLSNQEKRFWVSYHRKSNKDQVDGLSATAALRKKEGQPPLSEPLVWTDDLKPSKIYDALFDDTEFPLQWNNQQATEFYTDQIQSESAKLSPEDVETLKDEWTKAQEQYGSYSAPHFAVQTFFQKKKSDYDAQALIPVYTMEPNQTVQKSTHPVFNYTDQFGKKYFFKPRPNTKLDKYRSEVEHLGNQFGRLFGFSTADSKLIELDGKYGQLQSDVGGVTDLLGYDYSTLTPVQIADIGNEHLLDWFLDNDDSKGDNAKILANGRIVGIDKGRSFKHFGAWKGLSGNSSMDTNAHTIYSQLFDTIRAGKLDKADVDQAYLAIQRRAEKMAKVPDEKITEMLAEGMKNREQYDINYSIDGKSVPQNLAGMTAAVLDRKNRLPEQIQEMWAKVYKDAGFGDLPEKPDNPLGDVISGLDDARLHEQVFQAEASGKTTMIGGAHVIGGTALLWTDESSDGTTNLSGEMFLGPKKQKELLDYFISNATDMSSSGASSSPPGFGVFDSYGDNIIAGAKTVNHHAGDKNYNETTMSLFQTAKQNVESDLSEWSSDLQPNTTFNFEPAYQFKSGFTVPMDQLPQYKLMLDHYQPQTQKIQHAYETNGKTEVVSKFAPLTFSKGGEKYTHSDGSSLTKLGNGQFVFVDGETNSVSVLKEGDANWYYVWDAESGEGSWNPVTPSPGEKPTSGITIVKRSMTHEQSAKMVGHKKILTGGAGDVYGSSGQEYEVTLPTGEKIYFRNSAQTNTKRGQHGKLVFRAEGISSASESQAAVDRIRAQLNAMGVDTDAADQNHAELTYWREMYGVLVNRNHAHDSKYAKAKAKLDEKIKEIGGAEEEFLENLSEKLDSDAEVLYWRELYSEFWPDEVSNLISSEGYLPKFDHQNLVNPELETGKPYWERFDISLESIYAQNRVLGAGIGGDPLPLIVSGGSLSAEERLRQADEFNAGWSASSDQTYGSSHNIYTRVLKGNYKEYNAIFDPRMMLRTRTYSFDSDNYGKLANRKDSAPSDPLYVLKNFAGGGNETMLPHMATLLDGVELYAFDYEEKRNEAIQHLKKLGIEMIRGLPVEDRIIMRSSMNDAIEKIKKTWKEKLTP